MTEKNTFYVTTPIYYVNDDPHIGHAYTTLLADVLARYHRLLNEPTFFLTGTDEHGQKVEKAAAGRGISPQEQCDSTVVRFKKLWKKLEITHDDFIRTTESRHKNIVRKILQDLYDKDLIYKDRYSGNYCVPCERFFTDKDLAKGGLCPECGRETEEIIESNYFFRMSSYQEWLVKYITDNPGFIQPDFRRNETLGFLRKPLGDLCISRPKSRLSWGIELPFDSEYVCYVWFDALVNYISAAGYGSDSKKFDKWWPASYHLIGKDILTTHTVYWPTMLKAIGVEMPRCVFAHGWWLTGRDKMSKSLGNVVDPMDMAEKYGVDPFRYFLVSEMTLGQDASFTEEVFVRRYNSDLANDLGNLVSRVVKMAGKKYGGILPAPSDYGPEEEQFREIVLDSVESMRDATVSMRLDKGIEGIMTAVRAGNRYLERRAPWKMDAQKETEALGTVIYTAAEALRIISGMLFPVMPGKMREIRGALGIDAGETGKIDIDKLREWGGLEPGSRFIDMGPLFPRIDSKKKKSDGNRNEKKQTKKGESGMIDFDEFRKMRLVTAKVISAERVEGTDKLMCLEVDAGGDEARQIVAGIAEDYSPEEMTGRNILLVANLKPAKIRGVESNGMLLAARSPDGLKLISADGEPPPGTEVS